MLQIIIFIQIIEISILFLNILMIQTHISIIVIDIEKKGGKKKRGCLVLVLLIAVFVSFQP